MKVIGLAPNPNGDGFALVDSNGDTHLIRSPDQAWAAIVRIVGDRAIPEAEVTRVRDHEVVDGEIDRVGTQITHELEAHYGPVFGRAMGVLAKDVTRAGHRLARNISRKRRGRK